MKNTKNSPLKRQGIIAQSLGFNNLAPSQPFDYSAVADDIDESIKVGRERRRQNELDKRRRASFGFMQAEYSKGLMIPSDSGFSAIDDYAATVSRGLADRGSQLVTDLENNKISSAEFGRLYGTLQNQVGQIKPMLEALQTNFTTYATDNAQGVLSGANDQENEDFFQAGIEGRGKLEVDENGIVVFTGTTKNNKPFSIPANQLSKMPRPIKKVDSFESLTKPIADALGTPTEQEIVDPVTGQPTGQFNMSSIPADLNNTEFSKTVRSSFDNFVNENKMDGLKSLAVDYGGFTYDEMEEMANSGQFIPGEEDFTAAEIENIPGILEEMNGENFANKLEFEMEKLWIARTMDQTVDKQIAHWKQKEYNLQIAKIAAADRANVARMNQAKSLTERDRNVNLQFINQLPAPTKTNLSSWNLNAPTGNSIIEDEGKFYLVNKSGEELALIPESVMNNPNQLANVMAVRMYGVPAGMTSFNYAPIKKAGPIKKVREFFNI